jgi:hypothetical protein
MQLSYTNHICSQIVWIEYKKSLFQPALSVTHSKACDGMKTHAFSTNKPEDGAGMRLFARVTLTFTSK